MKRHHTFSGTRRSHCSSSSSAAAAATEISKKVTKMWEGTENKNEGGLDELMGVLGYKVKSSDMTQVAQKLELLEEAMGSVEQDGLLLSHFGSETVHYNPSDISSWLETMLSEFNSPQNDPFFSLSQKSFDSDNSVVIFDDSTFDSDLTAIPGSAIFPPPPSPPLPPPCKAEVELIPPPPPPCKRLKPNWVSMNDEVSLADLSIPRPVVLVDSQENGIRLVHALMACAEAIQEESFKVAEALVKQIGFLAVSQIGTMKKVATYFAEALARRIYKVYPTEQNDFALTDFLQMHFYETCPYLKFAHFTANQAILEAFAEKSHVHVIDFGIKQGMQWPPLLQALALRPGGPPSFRLTGIGQLMGDNDLGHLKEVGWKLAQMADSINVKFEYRYSAVRSIADLDVAMFDLREGETVAVNSIFELHQMLAKDGDIERVLDVVKELKPEVFTVVEQEANHNGTVFLDRFTEALHYYSTLFDSLEGCGGGGGVVEGEGGEIGIGDGCGGVSDQDKVMTEVYLGRQICNVVSCEGVDRVERHENLTQWRTRFNSMGFEPVHLGSNAFKQASMLLALFNGEGYKVEENNGCLLLGWHTRPLIATSAWKLS
ncbi:hypothetical protein Leryth_005822 [Lithospermum erythrorhizon]|nr:hypothetical protein Leryth_005822 [Lithospermum erythrorhizon]